MEQAAYAEMKRIALEFGLDVISLVGGLFSGGTSLAGSPTLSKLLLKVAKKSGRGIFGKLVRNILRRTQKTDVSNIDDIPDIPDLIGKQTQTPKITPKPKEPRFTDPTTGQPLKPVDRSTIKRPDGKPFDPLPRQKDYSLDPIVSKSVKKKKKKEKFYVGRDFGRSDGGGQRGTDQVYYNSYQSDGKESTLFERFKKKSFFNQDDIKPTFPENPPPELDPKTGMHPNYGKAAARYKKLDPASANAMPPTGDPETDAVVDKQRTKPRPKIQSTFSKIKKLRKKT